jgi:hypothetical protein
MGEHIDGLALFLLRGNVLDDLQPVRADGPVDGDILIGDFTGTQECSVRALVAWPVAYGRHHFVEGPFEIDRGGARGGKC